MIFIEGVKDKFIDTKGIVHECPRLNKRFYIAVDKLYKIDLIEKTVMIEVPGLGLDVYEVDENMLREITEDVLCNAI